MNHGLRAGLNASHVVTHGVHAGLGGVDLDDVLELSLAARKLIFPELALGLAIFDDLLLGVFTLLQHLLDIAYMQSIKSRLIY